MKDGLQEIQTSIRLSANELNQRANTVLATTQEFNKQRFLQNLTTKGAITDIRTKS